MIDKERYKIWSEVAHEFHKMDALERLAEHLGYDADGVKASDIEKDSRYIKSGAGNVDVFCDMLAERFEDEHDCGISDNQTWENIINRELHL